jgi:hypothetical protein
MTDDVADGECAVEIVANTDCTKEVLLPNGRFVPNAVANAAR